MATIRGCSSALFDGCGVELEDGNWYTYRREQWTSHVDDAAYEILYMTLTGDFKTKLGLDHVLVSYPNTLDEAVLRNRIMLLLAELGDVNGTWYRLIPIIPHMTGEEYRSLDMADRYVLIGGGFVLDTKTSHFNKG